MSIPNTARYEAVLSELLACGSVKRGMEVLRAHNEQVDEGMLEFALKDDRFDEFYTMMIGVVLMDKGIDVDKEVLKRSRVK